MAHYDTISRLLFFYDSKQSIIQMARDVEGQLALSANINTFTHTYTHIQRDTQ